jgi:cytochrome c
MNNRTIKIQSYSDHHGPAVATRLLLGVSLACALTASPLAIANPAELVESARCSMCHQAEAARVGPSWAAIAERYAGQEDAQQILVTRARAGGSGEWGKAPMPPVSEAQLSDADLEAVIAWILDR